MLLADDLNETESCAELVVKRVSGVSAHWQPTACVRTVVCERCDQDVAARPNGPSNLLGVLPSIDGVGQKMKHRAVVPDVDRGQAEVGLEDVGFQPLHA